MKTLKAEREAIVEAIKDYDENVGWVCYPDDVATALLSHEERVVAMVKKEVKSWLMNYDSKDGYSTAYDGVIEHIYDRVNTLTLPITDENV